MRRSALRRALALAGTLTVLMPSWTPMWAVAGVDNRQIFDVRPAASAIEVDGLLDEHAWTEATALDLNFETFPGDNTTPPVRTQCLVTHDDKYLHVAFRAFDANARALRAHLADRDTISAFQQDDHVGFQIDPFNDERRAFQFRVNPLGVQADAFFSEIDGVEDPSWDAIWRSATRVSAEGYTVEMAIPLQQLRFPGGPDVSLWGFDPFRSYPRRFRHRLGANPLARDRACRLCQVHKLRGFAGLAPGRSLELNPTLTGRRTDTRGAAPGGALERGPVEADAGLSLRWGPTPGLTLAAALNPDFSQVEADVAQLDVNLRFALFFQEKRPFFLEGTDFFATPLRAVYTRTVVAPRLGAKLTGKVGRQALGAFLTVDDVLAVTLSSNESSSVATRDGRVQAAVLRYRRDVGTGSTVGLLYTGRLGSHYHNHVGGADAFLRLSRSNTLRLQALVSGTRNPADLLARGARDGSARAFSANYAHASQHWSASASYEDIGARFRADAGFLPRADVRTLDGSLAYVLRGNARRRYARIDLGLRALHSEDQAGRRSDRTLALFTTYAGPWQSNLTVTASANRERLGLTEFDLARVDATLELRPAGALRLNATLRAGDALDVANARAGSGLVVGAATELRLGRHVELRLAHNREQLEVAGGRVLTGRLTELRGAYHFGTRAFVRLIGQYRDTTRDRARFVAPVDARTRALFGQALLSYKLDPQTVALAGYSFDSGAADGASLGLRGRTFFVKLGYAFLR
jgi:hypothetical protein